MILKKSVLGFTLIELVLWLAVAGGLAAIALPVCERFCLRIMAVMYCPNCGNKNAEGQNFCRSCGLGLEKIAQSLTEQLPAVAVKSLQERKERLERLGVASLSVFGLGIFGFLLYNIFFKLLLTQGPLVASLAVLGAIIFIGSGLLAVILFAKAQELKEAAVKRQIGSVTGELLESPQQPPFSISDRTTNLLPVDAKKE